MATLQALNQTVMENVMSTVMSTDGVLVISPGTRPATGRSAKESMNDDKAEVLDSSTTGGVMPEDMK